MKTFIFLLIFILGVQAFGQPSRVDRKTPRKSLVKSSWSIGGRLWQERTYLVDATGQKYALTDEFYGATLGYQRTYYRQGMSFRHELYGFMGQNNVSSAESTFTYFEKGVMTFGAGLSETLLWHAHRATLEYGINLDVFYRRAVFPEPTLNVTLEDGDRILFILGPQVRWNIFGTTFLEQRIGYSPQAQDLVWNFGLVYRGSLW